MSNTDGEDTQKVSLGELLLNAGTRIVDLEKQSNDQVEIITHLEKELASLREQLGMKEALILKQSESIDKAWGAFNLSEHKLKQKEDEIIEIRGQLVQEEKDIYEALEAKDKIIKQKEDENRELVNEIDQLILHAEEDSLTYSVLEHARKLVFKTNHPDGYKKAN